MTEDEIARVIVDAAIKVHRILGPGLLESAYESAMAHELSTRGLRVARQIGIAVVYDGIDLGEGFRADLLVEGKVLVELKSLEVVQRVHRKQVLTYLRLGNYRLGFLINFGVPLVKDGIERIVNGLPE